MREILELCVRMNDHARKVYVGMSEVCKELALSETFAALARDEVEQAGWWTGLLEAWQQGLLPDLVNDTGALSERLRALEADLARIDIPGATGDGATCDTLLALAARLEFHMMDTVFDELIDLTEPAGAERRHDAYMRHLQRLIDAISAYYEPDSLAGLLASTLSRTWKDNVRLAVFATHDALTGLYNRRALQAHLPQWTAWSARYGHPLAVLLLDVDYLKSMNDRFGHDMGDAALKAVAEALGSSTRASDLVVRYGGDEFAIVAPETGPDEYRELAGRILDAVRAVEMHTSDGRTVHVALSIGGAVADDPPGVPPRPVTALLAAADQSLYAGKTGGRDRAAEPVVLPRMVP